jgi:GTP pyrophosphokinase
MDYQLENGDIVEVIRSSDARPSPRWMNLLKTASARNRLKKFLATKDRPLLISRGRDMLNKELIRRRLAPLDMQLAILREVDGVRLTLHDREDLLAKIGQGALSIQNLLPRIHALGIEAYKKKAEPVCPVDDACVAKVESSVPMPTRFAKCCKADELRPPKLMGVIGRDGEVRVHSAQCVLLKHVNPERLIGVSWVVPAAKKPKLTKRIKSAALALARRKG